MLANARVHSNLRLLGTLREEMWLEARHRCRGCYEELGIMRPAHGQVLCGRCVERRAASGAFRVNWGAVVFGGLATCYLAGMAWVLSWMVPELSEFTR